MENSKVNIIFKYEISPTNNFLCNDSTIRNFTIKSDGQIVYEQFEFDSNNRILKECININNKIVNKIEKIIVDNFEKIISIPDNIYNDSCDGNFEIFTFLNKKIETMNIEKHDLKSLKMRDLKIYNKYKNIMIWENIIIDIVEQIHQILSEYDIINIFDYTWNKKIYKSINNC